MRGRAGPLKRGVSAQVRAGTVTFSDADRDLPAQLPSEEDTGATEGGCGGSGEPVIDLDWGALMLDSTEDNEYDEDNGGAQFNVAMDSNEGIDGAPGGQDAAINTASGDESLGSDGVKVAADGPAIVSWDCAPVQDEREQLAEAGVADALRVCHPPECVDRPYIYHQHRFLPVNYLTPLWGFYSILQLL